MSDETKAVEFPCVHGARGGCGQCNSYRYCAHGVMPSNVLCQLCERDQLRAALAETKCQLAAEKEVSAAYEADLAESRAALEQARAENQHLLARLAAMEAGFMRGVSAAAAQGMRERAAEAIAAGCYA